MSTATAKASPRIEVDGIREKLLQLGLTHAAEELPTELAEAVKHNRPAPPGAGPDAGQRVPSA